MLHQISWTSYIEAIIGLLAIYYAYVALKYYADDIRGILNPVGQKPTGTQNLPDALQYEEPEPGAGKVNSVTHSNPDNQPDDSIKEADQLIGQIKQCIQTASEKPFAPAVLIPQIKKLFRDNPSLQDSPHRPAINELVVSECERSGTALLNEDEVDRWWEGL